MAFPCDAMWQHIIGRADVAVLLALRNRKHLQQTYLTIAMKLLLVAIGVTCRNELAAGHRTPSEDLRALAKCAGLQSMTLDSLRVEVKQKLDAALAGAFA